MPAASVHQLIVATVAMAATLSAVQTGAPRPLLVSDIDDITALVKLEDTRRADEAALARMLQSSTPEVRRRAAIAVGRIGNQKAGALLVPMRSDADPEVAASVVFATGQLKDPATVAWLSEVMGSPRTAPVVAREAAIALGKIQIPIARTALAGYLAAASATAEAAPIVGEALLSIGRFTTRDDRSPLVRWAASPDVEVRWRAAWALFRTRDAAALPHLLRLSEDSSADVRFWAVRGLAPPGSTPVNAAASSPSAAQPLTDADRTRVTARLRDAIRDPDRRVRTEAIRALSQFDDDASFNAVMSAIDNTDNWVAISAVESMSRFQNRAEAVVPRLVAASQPARPLALRVSALAPLVTLAPDKALDLATSLARMDSMVARTAARQALGRLGGNGQTRLDALVAEGALVPHAGAKAGGRRGDLEK